MIPPKTWQSFIHDVVSDEPDDAYVRLLEDRLDSGARAVQVRLLPSRDILPGLHGGPPVAEYRVILERLQTLSELRVPHSPSFTRWSFKHGLRMASEDEEVARFALLIGERCASLLAEHGKDHFESILVERLRALGAPHTMNVLATLDVPPAPATRDKDAAWRDTDDLLVTLAHALVRSLGYSEADSADLLDRAFAMYLAALFQIRARPQSAAQD
jgi:hypothetical protein